jgi:hypothetical protein
MIFTAATLSTALVVGLGATFLSQGALEPEALKGPAAAQQDVAPEYWPHPAHIVTGTCLAPGDIVASLGPTAEPFNDPQGAVSFVHLDLVPGTGLFHEFDDFLAEPHAIVVRNGDDDPDTLIACGEIGGTSSVPNS